MQAIIIAGNPVDGFAFYGPYANRQAAVEAADEKVETDWWVAVLADTLPD